MKIVLGLGNPGSEYERNRHNVGFRCVDELAARGRMRWRRVDAHVMEAVGQLAGTPLVLARPLTYMNRSGLAARAVTRRHGEAADLVVVHDEADLPGGNVRIKTGGGHGGHNGVRSVMGELGSGDFIRVRLGLGRSAEEKELADWVLSDFEADEEAMAAGLVRRAADAVETVILAGVAAAMNTFNTRGSMS